MYVTMPYICMHIKWQKKNWMTKKGASFSMAQNYRFSLSSDPCTLQHWAKKKKNYHLKWEYFNYSLCQKDGWQFGQQYPAVPLLAPVEAALIMRVSDSGCSFCLKAEKKENDEQNWPLSPDFSCDSLSLQVVLCVSP